MNIFQLSSQIVTLNSSVHSPDFNAGARLLPSPNKTLPTQKARLAPARVVVAGGCFGLRTWTRLHRKRTEKDVVRDLGCDNQEIKISFGQKKYSTISVNKRKQLFCCSVLQILSSFMFPAALVAVKSYSHLK